MIKKTKLLFLFLPFCLAGQQVGFGLEQIKGQAIIDQNLNGKGIKVGIIDGGFLRANEKESLSSLFENNQVAGYKDYLDSTATEYSGSKALDDIHGAEVWELLAGMSRKKGVQYGLATGATFYLARTDHGGYEKRDEEHDAVRAMEWMAKEGVKIINFSLGYNYGYSNAKDNYKPEQMDGRSTILTQAVDRISKKYDILFVVAAGNDGSNQWRIIDSPADAESALTVGATKYKTWDDMKYSSKGPDWLDYVKPEVSCYASSGTSFSAPIITGLAACLLEKKPSMTGQELKELIIKSCSLGHPNNYIGYGVPNAEIALKLIDQEQLIRSTNSSTTSKNRYKHTLNKSVPYFTVYHKKGWVVLHQETLRSRKSSIKIRREDLATSSTILWEGGNLEVFWK